MNHGSKKCIHMQRETITYMICNLYYLSLIQAQTVIKKIRDGAFAVFSFYFSFLKLFFCKSVKTVKFTKVTMLKG